MDLMKRLCLHAAKSGETAMLALAVNIARVSEDSCQFYVLTPIRERGTLGLQPSPVGEWTTCARRFIK
jgi:hypothetical protein